MEKKRIWLTASEAAKYLGISLPTLKKIEGEGKLMPFHTPGGHRRYSIEMLDKYLESTRAAPQGEAPPVERLLNLSEGLQRLISRVLRDVAFRAQFLGDPIGAALGAGFDLREAELAALKEMDTQQLSAALEELDERVSKSGVGIEDLAGLLALFH